MTTRKDFTLTDGIAANSNAVAVDTQTRGEERDSPVETKPTTAPSLRRRLLTTVLPITLIPLSIIGVFGFLQTEAQLKQRQNQQLEEVGLLSSSTTTVVINNHLEFHGLIENNPLVLNALKAGSKQVQDQGLAQQPIAAVEQKFAGTKLLKPNAALNAYLKQAATKSGLAEIVLTERNGFNVGYNQITTDFVQNDEDWWQKTKESRDHIGVPEFDKSANAWVIGLTRQIRDDAGEMIGVMKIGLPLSEMNEIVRNVVSPILTETEIVQVISAETESPLLETIALPENKTEIKEIMGGEDILAAARILTSHDHGSGGHIGHDHEEHTGEHADEEHEGEIKAQSQDGDDLQEVRTQLDKISGIQDLTLVEKESSGTFVLLAEFTYKDRFYNLSLVPNTEIVMASSVSTSEVAATASSQSLQFLAAGFILTALLVATLYWLAQTLSNPLTNLSGVATEAADGNLNVRADVAGTRETRTLARTFNSLVSEVQSLLTQAELSATEQKDSRDKLEMDIYQLLDEVGEATDGDLTVRASLTSMEMSTVADLFNAIIDNLNDIAGQVKASSVKVSSSLDENGREIKTLAEQAIQETKQARNTLDSIEKMSVSIEDVATNAGRAAVISDEAYVTVQEGSMAMDQTVDSILSLRNTVGETSKKIKRLGESSQKISQVVSLIEEIALKTNLLAINASVEASRAGEQGQGFTVVAEQVGALAEQSAAATKEIARIVAGIQAETKEVTEAMEIGTTQVVDSSRLVETTKGKLTQVLTRSQEINDLMRSISDATVNQTETSKAVTSLMAQMAELAEQRATSSTQMAQSMEDTAAVAQKLEATVAQFKVEEES